MVLIVVLAAHTLLSWHDDGEAQQPDEAEGGHKKEILDKEGPEKEEPAAGGRRLQAIP